MACGSTRPDVGAVRKVQETPNASPRVLSRSPYAVAKLYAYWITSIMRSLQDARSNGILFNTNRRSARDFVTRKITGRWRRSSALSGLSLSRQSRRATRLGMPRLCRGHVADLHGRGPTTTCWRPARRTPCGNSSSCFPHSPSMHGVAMATTSRAAAAHRPGGGGDRRFLPSTDRSGLLLGDPPSAEQARLAAP